MSDEKSIKHSCIGSSFDDFLKEEGIYEECDLAAQERLKKEALRVVDEIIRNQVDMCDEFAALLNEHFWELV